MMGGLFYITKIKNSFSETNKKGKCLNCIATTPQCHTHPEKSQIWS